MCEIEKKRKVMTRAEELLEEIQEHRNDISPKFLTAFTNLIYKWEEILKG